MPDCQFSQNTVITDLKELRDSRCRSKGGELAVKVVMSRFVVWERNQRCGRVHLLVATFLVENFTVWSFL